MTEREQEPLEPQELAGQEAEELPAREAMSVLNLPGSGLAPPEIDPPELQDANQ